jgi:serine/threonine protein kinase
MLSKVAEAPIPDSEACRIIYQVLLALNYLHKTKNLIHGNLSLDTILCLDSGDVKLTEVGLVCVAHAAAWY